MLSDEHVLRSRGYDKTPDVKLEVPVAVNGRIINWIESKVKLSKPFFHLVYTRARYAYTIA